MGLKPETREAKPVTLKELQRGVGVHAGAAHHGEKIVPITKNGKEFAALIGPSDLARLRQLDSKQKRTA